MTDPKTWKRAAGAAGLVAAGLVAGGILAGTLLGERRRHQTRRPTTGTSSSHADCRPVAAAALSTRELLTGDTKAQGGGRRPG